MDAEVVEAGGADEAVVEVLGVVGAAGDVDGIAALEINGLGGGDGVVGFGFEDHAAGGGAGVEFGEFGAEGDFVAGGPGGEFGVGGEFLDGTGFAPAGAVEDRLFVFYLS